jgi:hypothetical protein
MAAILEYSNPALGAISAAHCAAFCLARLWRKQRKPSEARELFDFVFG